jgi:hypothetical protein
LLKVAAETLITIAADPEHLGARIGLTAVLHTWGSALTCASAPKRDPRRIWANILIQRWEFGHQWGPNRHRSGPHPMAIFVFHSNELSPSRVGSRFGAETHLLAS